MISHDIEVTLWPHPDQLLSLYSIGLISKFEYVNFRYISEADRKQENETMRLFSLIVSSATAEAH